MTIDEYAELEQGHTQMVFDLKKNPGAILKRLTPHKCDLLHMAYCIPGEAGELSDAIKKHIFYEKEFTDEMREHVVEELGDLEFYMEGLRQSLGISRTETLKYNRTKLLTGKNARYGKGVFSNEQAQERADKQEPDDVPQLCPGFSPPKK